MATYKKYGFKYPASDKIWSRTSTVARSMASTLMPRIGYDNDHEEPKMCVYCGDKANHLDHLFPLVKEKYPFGYITEPDNLVPCCEKCNQSKGAKEWRDYMDLSNYITLENITKFLTKQEGINNYVGDWIEVVLDNLSDIQLKDVLNVLNKNQLVDFLNDANQINQNKTKKKDEIISLLVKKEDIKKQIKNKFLNNDKMVGVLAAIAMTSDKINDCLESLAENVGPSCDAHKDSLAGLLLIYLEHIIEDSANIKDSKEKILRRLLIHYDKSKNDSNVSNASNALNSLKSRVSDLEKYCSQDNSSDTTVRIHKLKFFEDKIDSNMPDIKGWWDNMYNDIKSSLGSAQIQIEAFIAGIQFAAFEKGKGKCFDCFFRDFLAQELKNKNDNTSSPQDSSFEESSNEESNNSSSKYEELGFKLDNNQIVCNKTAEDIYQKAKDAFSRGQKYYKNTDKNEQANLEKLYPLKG